MRKNILSIMSAFTLAALLAVALTGCGDDDSALEDAAEDVEDAADDAADEMGDAMDDAGDAIEDIGD